MASGRLRLGLILRFGEHYPRVENPIRWPELRSLARLAEAVGFDTLWCDDHFVYETFPPNSGPHGKIRGVWDSFTLLSAVAEATSRVTIGPFVACTSFRNPAHLAKIADTLDDISGGRLILGLGAGWNKPEYDVFGYPFDHLASRFDEALQIIHPLLRDGYVDFKGTYYEARECELRPCGPRPNGLPIWIGATKPRMLGLVARYADAFNAVWHVSPETMVPRFADADAACLAAGRDPATLLHTSGSYISLPAPGEDPPVQLRPTIRSMPEGLAEHMTISLEPWNAAGLERAGRMIEALRKLEAS